MALLRILHLVGSAYDDLYCNLSREYAQCSLVDTASFASLYDFRIAFITPDGQWRFPRSLSPEDIAAAKPMSLPDAIQFIIAQKIDLVLPHMYCIPGMTHYRALFDLLKIPYMSNTPDVMAITAHKGKTKAIVAAAGVKVPFGELLRRGDVPTVPPPAIVKPASADNSLGVSLVKEVADYTVALQKAFEHAEEVIVEAFIEPGREVRCGIIVKDGQLISLPLEEYLVDPHKRPIRTYDEKFPDVAADGKFHGWTTSDIKTHWIVDPNDPITQKVQQVAKKCHLALGCRLYSMFDFRIDPKGEPWFLEAGLYCSFGYGSGIPHTAKAAGIPLDELFMMVVKETLNMN
jgi:D-alanine-D-alanine ligase